MWCWRRNTLTGKELYLQGWQDCLESLEDVQYVEDIPKWVKFEESVATLMFEECYDTLQTS